MKKALFLYQQEQKEAQLRDIPPQNKAGQNVEKALYPNRGGMKPMPRYNVSLL